jgi:predicted RecA/RadA family phage recombinase
MKNFVQPGQTLTVTAPYNVASGAGVLVGSLFGVATAAALLNAQVEIETEGVFDLVKVGSQAWSVGARVYWDDTAKNCTTTASTNKLIGVAVAAVGSGAGETVGRVRLTAAFTL